MTRLGFQIPNFTFPDVPHSDLFARVALMARTAEESGFDTLFVMDHFYQLPMLGAPEAEMLEGWGLLHALGASTSRARLSTLVTGVTYRNPAHLAKLATTLDVVSGGRAMLGIGGAWFEPEHVGYGFEFPPLGERLSRLEEALQIIAPMLRGERVTFTGERYRTEDAINSPPPLQADGIPILIGGNGEKRTLRLVARFASESNLTCAPAEIPRKLETLERHCAELGRDRSEIRVSKLSSLVLAPTFEQAEAARDEFLHRRGMDYATLPDAVRQAVDAALLVGDPDSIGEVVQKDFIGAGLDGIVVNLPANGHNPESITLAAETLNKAIG